MKFHSIYSTLLILITFLFACNPANQDAKSQTGTETEADKRTEANTKEIKSEEPAYDDALVQKRIEEALAKPVSDPKNKAMAVSSLNCIDVASIANQRIDFNLVKDKHSSTPALNASMQHRLQVKSCWRKVNETDDFVSFIFFSDIESHYSERAVFVNITKTDQIVHMVDLAYEYYSENLEKSTYSIFKNALSFKRTTKVDYHHPTENGKIDSSKVIIDSFTIGPSGNFIMNGEAL